MIIFVFINCEERGEQFVLEEIRKLDIVKNAERVIGTYDIVAKLESDLMEELNETITWKIRKISRVRSTLIIMVKSAQTIVN